MAANAINISQLVIWPMMADTESDTTYGDVTSLVNRFMSFSDAPKQVASNQRGDGKVVSEFVTKNGGELTLNITALVSTEKSLLYGERIAGGTNIMNMTDLIPFVGVGFVVENDDGTVDLYKYPKVKFTEQPTKVNQKGENGVTYATDSLKGNYIFTNSKNDGRYILEDLDKLADGATILKWLTDGAFYKKDTVTNTSLKKGV